MDWQAFFARDSYTWKILFYGGLGAIVATGLIDNPSDYGLSPLVFRWMKLLVAVVTALGGKNGMSWVKLTGATK